jgi:pilus assembly protein TadC
MKPSPAKRPSGARSPREPERNRRGARAAVAAVIAVPLLLFIVIELPFILEGIYGLSAGVTRAVMWISAVVVAGLALWMGFRPER